MMLPALVLRLSLAAWGQGLPAFPDSLPELPSPPPAPRGIAVDNKDSDRRALRAAGLDEKEIDRVLEAADIIGSSFIESVSRVRSVKRALEGIRNNRVPGSKLHSALKEMAGQLDKHSYFMTPDEYKKYLKETQGIAASVGILYGNKKKGEPMKIQEVFPGGPAERAGLRAAQDIMELDGKDVLPMEEADFFDALPKGGVGTRMRLKVKGRYSGFFEVTLERQEIRIPDLYRAMLTNNVGYVQIASFQEGTDARLKQALGELQGAGMTQLIVDLRNNPGGKMSACVNAAGLFLSRGKLIASVTQGSKTVDKFSEDGSYDLLRLAVVINAASASCSETFTAALQDHGRAVVVGRTSYGKGVAQGDWEFGDGSALHLTFLRCRTPSGRSVDGVGITPDFIVGLSKEAEDRVSVRLSRQLSGQAAVELDPDIKAVFK